MTTTTTTTGDVLETMNKTLGAIGKILAGLDVTALSPSESDRLGALGLAFERVGAVTTMMARPEAEKAAARHR
jgi:hypothetical protein